MPGNPAPRTDHLVQYQWQPGQSANPAGRPKGARSRLSENLLKALDADFAEFGADAIKRVRERKPDAYLAACVSLLPKQQQKIESPFVDLTDRELELLEEFLKSTRAKNITPVINGNDPRLRED